MENWGYSKHTKSTESKKSLRQNYVVNETSLSFRCLAVVNSVGGHTRYLVYMDMDAAARFELRIF